MRKRASLLFVVMLLGIGLGNLAQAAEQEKEMPGQELAFDKNKGNCLACHAMPGTKGEMPGSIAPPLIAMKLRYPDIAILRAQVWDASINNEKTVMPPFGKHHILTEKEIDQVLEFIYSL